MRKAVLVTSAAAAGVLLVYVTCAWELFFPSSKRALMHLKNRTSLPAAADYDPRVTLPALLEAGPDRDRWSSSRAATIEGYVVALFAARPEAANCYSFARRDTHIEVALSPAAPERQRVTVEVTPALRDWASGHGLDWSAEALERTLVGRRVRISGWLLFDEEHDKESENTNPGDDDNWRATAWEIHPVTSIALVP